MRRWAAAAVIGLGALPSLADGQAGCACTWEMAVPSGTHWSGGSDNKVVAAANNIACQKACCDAPDGCDAYTYALPRLRRALIGARLTLIR